MPSPQQLFDAKRRVYSADAAVATESWRLGAVAAVVARRKEKECRESVREELKREKKNTLSQRANRQVMKRRLKSALVSHLGGRCESCGYRSISGVLDFHHLDSSEKVTDVSKLIPAVGTLRSIEVLLAEVEKCILLCPTCHQTEHYFAKSLVEGVSGPLRTVIPEVLNRPF